jgi:hypothetical protein
MIIGLQIIALLFAFSMVYFAVLHFKRGEINGAEMVSWLLMWSVAIVVTVFPELLRSFAKTFLVTRVFDLMVIGGFVLVISMVAVAYVRTRRLEKRLEELIRKQTLKQSEAEKRK